MSARSPCHTGRTVDPVSLQLLHAATTADEAAVLDALLAGADVNALDASGRTVVGCAIAGNRWNEVDASDASYSLPTRLRILKTFITHEKVSLHTLNAPQSCMRGVTPLGLAAWLNIPEVVRLLLEECSGLVSVDGMDTLGATPLMYAARDGGVAVVRCLLSHGARPDFRDVNHRTSIQHALCHPQVLWLCESALRRHRARETISQDNKRNLSQLYPELDEELAITTHITCHPRLALRPPKQNLLDMATRLITCVRTTDVQQLHSLLFAHPSATSAFPPPYLVNYPDETGWSPIHHCVSVEKPSLTVLDILYRAGADLSLYSRSSHGTPLHCLAYSARSSISQAIRAFIWHLVIDLRAPLSARDENQETCIHIAAEHGNSLTVLMALLACDASGTIQELRNARGLTAVEVAKPEFRAAFSTHIEQARCASSASARTIKPSTTSIQSASSLASLHFRRRLEASPPKHNIPTSLTELELETLPCSILDHLQALSDGLSLDPELVDIRTVEHLLQEATDMGDNLLSHMQCRADEAEGDLDGLRSKLALFQTTIQLFAGDGQHEEQPMALAHSESSLDYRPRRTTDSNESDRTAVSDRDSSIDRSVPSITIGVATDIATGSLDDSSNAVLLRSCPPSDLLSGTPLYQNLRPIRSMVNLGQHKSPMDAARPIEDNWFLKFAASRKEPIVARRDKRTSVVSPTEKEQAKHGASRVRAWLKKKFAPEPICRLPSPKESEELIMEKAPVATEECREDISVQYDRVKLVACADLARIRETMDAAERNISSAKRYITQARRVLNMVLEHRLDSMERARLIQHFSVAQPDDFMHATSSRVSLEKLGPVEFPPVTIPSSPRDSQLVFPRPPASLSPKSSQVSLASTLIEGEDEEIRYLRIVLTQKIEKRTDSAFVQLEKAATWLRIVREVTRPLRQRTNESSVITPH